MLISAGTIGDIFYSFCFFESITIFQLTRLNVTWLYTLFYISCLIIFYPLSYYFSKILYTLHFYPNYLLQSLSFSSICSEFVTYPYLYLLSYPFFFVFRISLSLFIFVLCFWFNCRFVLVFLAICLNHLSPESSSVMVSGLGLLRPEPATPLPAASLVGSPPQEPTYVNL